MWDEAIMRKSSKKHKSRLAARKTTTPNKKTQRRTQQRRKPRKKSFGFESSKKIQIPHHPVFKPPVPAGFNLAARKSPTTPEEAGEPAGEIGTNPFVGHPPVK
jgi:hypothetical protein